MSGYSESQIEALKAYIAVSGDASEICKKAVLWLIDQSGNLSKAVRTKMIDQIGEEITRGIGDMNSCGGTTPLGSFLAEQEIEAYFSSCTTGKNDQEEVTWEMEISLQSTWGEEYRAQEVEEIPFDFEAIKAVVLPT